MGGDIFIGIRKRNGEIYLGERWTNPTSWWFNNPAFYDPDEKVLDQYINLQEVPRPQTEIHPSEYGVILYDALPGKVFSRQCYTGIGKTLVSLHDEEMMELALEAKARGIITGLEAYTLGPKDDTSFWGPRRENGPIIATPDKHPRFFEIVEGALKAKQEGNHWYAHELPPNENAMFEVRWKIDGLEIDHVGGVHGYNHWPDVLKWVSAQGWACPIWSQETVDQKYHLGDEDEDDLGDGDGEE